MSQSYKSRKRLDPEKTRGAILDSALRVFATKGYSGTSIGDIAKDAEVAKSLVQYHFGSKEQLWQECLQRKAGPMLAALERVLAGEGNLMELVQARIEVHQGDPHVSRLFAWASLESVPLPAFLLERVGQMRDRMASRPESLEHLLVAFATIDGWFLHKPLYERLLQTKLDAQVDSRVADCVAEWVRAS